MRRLVESTLIFLAVVSPAVCQTQSYSIATVAGGADPHFYEETGDGGLATSAGLAPPAYGVAIDGAKNLYILAGDLIRKVTPTGRISTVAGGGTSVGDFVPATQAHLSPLAIVSDTTGKLYIADTAFGNSRIRMVDTKGIITTIAGGAPCCDLGDGGPSTAAYLAIPYGLALDSAGSIYVAQSDTQYNLIRKISIDGSIQTVAGGGQSRDDGVRATGASLARPVGIAVDENGILYIAENTGNRIRKVLADGTIVTVAGSGAPSTSGDGGPALNAGINSPWGVAVDVVGNIFVSQINDERIRMISTSGTVNTIAGNGTNSTSGDGGAAAAASLEYPAGLAVGSSGEIYVAQAGRPLGRVRLLAPTAGGPTCPGALSIAGSVTVSGRALPGVRMVLSGSSSASSLTDATGIYSFSTLSCGGSYSLTPALSGYNFAPPSLAFSNLNSNQTGANFTATSVSSNVSLSVSPSTLEFSYQATTTPSSQTMTVSSSVGPTSFIAVTQTQTPAGVNWLAVNPSSGITPATLTVSLSNTTLAAGTYSGAVTVSLPDGTGVQTVGVTLTVGAAFDAQVPSLQFTVSNGSGPAQSVLVTNLSPEDLTITAGSQKGYVDVAPQHVTVSAKSGNRQSQFVISPKPSSLPGGLLNFADSLVLSAAGQVLSFPLSISLSNESGQPLLSSTALTLLTAAGENDNDQTQVQLLNAGTSPLDFFVTQVDPWVTISPSGPVCTTPPSCTSVLLGPQLVQTLTFATNDGVRADSLLPPPGESSVLRITTATVRYGTAGDVISVYLDILPKGTTLPPRASAAGVLVGLPEQTPPIVTLRNPLSVPESFTISAPSWLPVKASSNTIQKHPGTVDLTIGPPTGVPSADEIKAGSKVTLEFSGIKLNGATYTLEIQAVYAGLIPDSGAGSVESDIRPRRAAATPLCAPAQLSSVFASPTSQFQATAGLPQNLVAQIADNCGGIPDSVAALVTFSSGESPISLTRWPDGLWRGTWQPQAPQTGLVTLLLSASSPNIASTAQAFVTGSVIGSSGVPVVMSKSVVDAASVAASGDALVPGEIISIYGTGLSSKLTAASGAPQTQLGGVQVTANGTPLPLFFVSANQINAVVPSDLKVGQVALLTAIVNGVPSVPLPMAVVSERPGIFTQSASGSGLGSIIDNGTEDKPALYRMDAAHPAHPGDILSIYCTGLGEVFPAVDFSKPAPASPVSRVTGQVSVIIGNASAEVLFAGLAPGFTGLYQVNARVPAAVSPGNIPLQMSVNNIPSNGVLLVVQ